MKKLTILLFVLLLTGLCASAQSGFNKKIADAVKQLSCAEPTEQEPVTLNAGLLAEKDSIAVIVKVKMAPGWHIYQYVPSNMPYIPIELLLKLPDGMQAVGKWEKAKPFPSANDPGVLIYENEAWFVQKVVRSSKAAAGITIQTGLYYQTCDLKQCLPPVEKMFDLKS